MEAISEIKRTEVKNYRRSFLIHHRDQLIPLGVEKIAYFYIEDELIFCKTHEPKRYVVDLALDKVENQTDPQEFFRVNRQFLISRQSVVSASQHFNRKLKLDLIPPPETDVIISKTKAIAFKKWLENAD